MWPELSAANTNHLWDCHRQQPLLPLGCSPSAGIPSTEWRRRMGRRRDHIIDTNSTCAQLRRHFLCAFFVTCEYARAECNWALSVLCERIFNGLEPHHSSDW